MASFDARIVELLSDSELERISRLLAKFGLSDVSNMSAAGACFDLAAPVAGGGSALSGSLMALVGLLLVDSSTPDKRACAAIRHYRAVCQAPGHYVTTLPTTPPVTPTCR